MSACIQGCKTLKCYITKAVLGFFGSMNSILLIEPMAQLFDWVD